MCPECGIPIEMSIRGDNLANRLPTYLLQLRRGALIVVLALNAFGIAMIAAILGTISLFSGAVASGTVGFGLAISALVLFIASFVLYLIGWFVISPIDPGTRDTPGKTHPQRFVRVTALLMMAAAVAYVLYMLIVPHVLTAGQIQLGSVAATSLQALGMFVQWGNPAAWALQYVAAAFYLRWLSERVPNAKVYKRASRLMWLGPLLMLASFTVVAPIIALGLLYNLVALIHEDLKRITGQISEVAASGSER